MNKHIFQRHRALLTLLTVAFISTAWGCRPTPAAADLRTEFRQLVFKDRKPGDLNAKVLRSMETGANRVERVSLTTEPGQEAILVFVRPKREGRYPTVLIQHFLGGSKDHQLIQFLMMRLASAGFAAAAIDGRYRGDRENGKTLQQAMTEAVRTGKGHPWLLDTVFDDVRTIDYLVTRPDVDPARIGMTGISEGGMETWMAAVIDERIQVAVPVIAVTRFTELFKNLDTPAGEERIKMFEPLLKEVAADLGEKQVNEKVLRTAWERLLPGSLDKFDPVHLVPLIAPRPLLILNHGKDELIPIEGAREVHTAAQARYKELKAEDALKMTVRPNLKHSGIDFTEPEEAVQWLIKWLKPTPVR